jgi:hypothetical protein
VTPRESFHDKTKPAEISDPFATSRFTNWCFVREKFSQYDGIKTGRNLKDIRGQLKHANAISNHVQQLSVLIAERTVLKYTYLLTELSPS